MLRIYTVNLLRIENRTPESFEEELLLERFKSNREISLDQYKEMICSFNPFNDVFKLCNVNENAYFLGLTDAKDSVKTNCADINEAGFYNYACIVAYPVGVMYGTSEPSEFYLFTYNRETNEYVEVSSDEAVYKFTAKEIGAELLIANNHEEGNAAI